jgi:hypothetical protein
MSTLPIQAGVSKAPARKSGLWPMSGVWLALSRLAGRLTRPRPAVQRDAAAEAQEVRELAIQMRRADPRFADELFAAADRHERLYG